MTRSNDSLFVRRTGFSLLELLVVVSIIVGVLGLSSLGLKGLNRDRQGALAELRGVLETARATAMAQDTDVYVAFATNEVPDSEHRYRRYALFLPDPAQSPAAPSAANIFQRQIVGISEWYALPDGLLLAFGTEVDGGAQGLATIVEAPTEFQREFSYEGATVKMPFFLFNARGMMEIPPVFGERYHRIGVVEAAYQEGSSTFGGVPNRIHLGWQQSGNSKVPRASCLGIDAGTGLPMLLVN